MTAIVVYFLFEYSTSVVLQTTCCEYIQRLHFIFWSIRQGHLITRQHMEHEVRPHAKDEVCGSRQLLTKN